MALSALAMVGAVFAGCGSDDDSSSGGSSTTDGGGKAQKVAVLLPDTKSSIRWESIDRPLVQKAFDDAGVPVEIQNAQGDKSAQQQQAEQAITNGAKILLLTNLDSGSGAAIQANAKSRGVKVIDYDRLTLKGSGDYYVSFDNVKVGKLQGEGLAKCLADGGPATPNIAELNGSPDDNNATLFAQGYNSVLDPMYQGGKATKVADQAVPDWDNQQALTIFEQMLQKENNNIQGVLAANDGLGNSVISALKARKLKQIPVTGQDATPEGIQNILSGDQCMTVWKPADGEAKALSDVAIALLKGDKPKTTGTVKDTEGNRDVKAILLDPISVTKDNLADAISKGAQSVTDVCTGAYAPMCASAGIK